MKNSLTNLAFTFGLFAIGFNIANAQEPEWIDVTEVYIKNAHYVNNNADFWQGTELGFAGPKQNAEHYNKNFDTYQDLSGLSSGTYRLSLKGYYRAGASGDDWNHFTKNETEYQFAQLYATSSSNDSSVPLVFCSSGASEQSLGGGVSEVGNFWESGLKYIPNNMEAAYYWFQAGYYDNKLEGIEVDDDGTLRIGIRKSQTINSDWTCFTDWKLEYYGVVKKIQSLSFPSSIKINIGDTVTLKPIIIPEDATVRKLSWQSDDASVVTVSDEGLLTAIAIGNATITVTATDGSGVTAQCSVSVVRDSGSTKSIIINEIMPANLDLFIDPSWNFGGYIEIYNPTDNSASLVHCYLSDDPDNLKKWYMPYKVGSVPAHGFKNIWFDHNDQYATGQCPFKLDVDGGTIYVSDIDGNLIVSQDYPPAFRRCSYSRTTDGGDEWAWTGNPTPAASNAKSSFASEQMELPMPDKEGQVFSGNLQVVVNIPEGATLRYTTDGSVPTLENGYTSATGIFSVSSSTAYRFRFFKTGFLPSDVKTCSYILNEYDFCGPIISIVTNNKNINGGEYGIFVAGNGHGRSGRGQQSKCNWNMDWDRPVSFEYLPDGKEVCFSQEVNMSAVGGWSRAWTPHSFKLKAAKEYGLKYMPYSFFDDKPYNKNKTLQIRNGGNDTGCRIIDPCIAEIVARSGIDVDCQAYKPVFVYINGKIYNVLNMREPNNKHYAYANRGLNDEEMDQFEYSPDSAYVQMAGTRESFDKWYTLSADASDPETYEEIKNIVDIDEFINYMAVEMYIGGSDWLNNSNNVKGYKAFDGKFRFVLFDTDGYNQVGNQFTSIEQSNWQSLDYIYDIGGSLYKEIELITIWLNMLQNEEFCKQFVDAFCLVAGSVFEPARCRAIIEELANHANDLMRQLGGSPWNSANGMISAFSTSRQSSQINNMKRYHLLNPYTQEQINASISADNEEGRLLLNGQPIPTNRFSGTLFLPATVRAVAPAGYRFAGWKNKGKKMEKVIFPVKTPWKYYDKGSLDGKKWYVQNYSENWNEGDAPLGYATGSTWTDYTTALDWGTDVNNRRPTFYFRKQFQLASKPSADDTFTLSFSVDDGCIIYVNGVEAGRFNMPDGQVGYSTYASTYGDQFSYPQTISISPELFVKGMNTIAVEVHNNDNKSSDIHWEAALYSTLNQEPGSDEFISSEQEIELTGDADLVAVFRQMTETELEEDNAVPVRINEVSAGNSIYVNEHYEKEDWIELYNTTDEVVDIAGLYLSDNVDKPQKYQIPASSISTLIEPFGFKVVWCDKLEAISQLHADFKLSNTDGSYVLLTSSDLSWADTLQYDAHNGDMTFGRYPDGNRTVFALNRPTIGTSNTITSYDTIHTEVRPEPIPDAIDWALTSRDGDMSMSYSGGYILVKNEEGRPVMLEILTTAGQLVTADRLQMRSGHDAWRVDALPRGVYIARARDDESNSVSIKLIIN
ncbi:MAG: CotH kinase family protein [Bacteroidaceae bacterium]|nr:CotH kinase family protein [Bacteroidaceae bacterium]